MAGATKGGAGQAQSGQPPDGTGEAGTLNARTVRVGTAAGLMPAYAARPDAHATAAVIVVQEAFGVNAHIQDVCRRVAAEGYLAVAPHLFYRTGDPDLAYDDFPAVGPQMQALSRGNIEDDLDATLGWLDDQGFAPGRVGIVGFCMGGSIALFAAVAYPLGAAVTFYGGGVAEGRFGFPSLIELASGLTTPWLGLYGDKDQGIPSDQVEALRTAAGRSGVPSEIVRYPDAGHGFHCDARPAAYSPVAARDAWARAVSWLRLHLPEP